MDSGNILSVLLLIIGSFVGYIIKSLWGRNRVEKIVPPKDIQEKVEIINNKITTTPLDSGQTKPVENKIKKLETEIEEVNTNIEKKENLIEEIKKQEPSKPLDSVDQGKDFFDSIIKKGQK